MQNVKRFSNGRSKQKIRLYFCKFNRLRCSSCLVHFNSFVVKHGVFVFKSNIKESLLNINSVVKMLVKYKLWKVITVLFKIFLGISASTHWVVTENGKIQPQVN